MPKLVRRTPQQPPAGAFGRAARRTRTSLEAAPSTNEERRRLLEVLSVEYSYDELLEIAANMRREAERSHDISEMFAELGGRDRLEHALYETHLWRLAKSQERRRASSTSGKSEELLARLRRKAKAYYQRVIGDPLRCAERRIKDRLRYQRRRSIPELREHMKALNRASQRKHRQKRYAYDRAWYARNRAERTPAYERIVARERERWRRDCQDEERLEKRRKASRECMRRKRERLQTEDPAAYRAFLDARNAKRTPNRAKPRWTA